MTKLVVRHTNIDLHFMSVLPSYNIIILISIVPAFMLIMHPVAK